LVATTCDAAQKGLPTLNNKEPLVIGWKLADLNINIASVRYRAILPLLALRETGVESKVFSTGWSRNLDGIDVLVIVKSFRTEDILLAQSAAERNIPVVFDLCDNIFWGDYGGEAQSVPPSDVFRQIAIFASAIVTPTDSLSEVVRHQLGDKPPVYTVPDGLETEVLIDSAAEVIAFACKQQRLTLRDRVGESKKIRLLVGLLRLVFSREEPNDIVWLFRRKLQRLWSRVRKRILAPILKRARKLMRVLRSMSLRKIAYRLVKIAYRLFEGTRAAMMGRPSRVSQETVMAVSQTPSDNKRPLSSVQPLANARRLLWFGNYGARHSARFGLIDLVDIRSALEQIACEFNVELVVVSNNAEMFRQFIAPLAIRSRYVEWSPARVHQELVCADVVLVPNSCDAFSICKSANRTVLALMSNRPVVATQTPALGLLADCVESGDLYLGIRRYLSAPEHVRAHLAVARARCERLYGQAAIASAWQGVFDTVRAQAGAPQAGSPELLLVANLVQDVEFVLAIALAARDQGVATTIWVSASMIRRWPYALRSLSKSRAPLRIIEERWGSALVPNFPSSVRAVLTIADTNLGPHRFSRSITQAANKAGINTGTIQHGFENVGLTYSDEIQAIERVTFDAAHIFIWGDPSHLHPRVREETRQKCISVGYPKMPANRDGGLPSAVPTDKPIVGIFENLHWHRYDDGYRSFFLEGLLRLAVEHPEVTFIIKPHNAGLWLTTRLKEKILPPENMLIADPSHQQWEGVTADALLPYLVGVITSPSTVALDAARAGLPVALVSRGLSLGNYAPLYCIENPEHWSTFLEGLFEAKQRQEWVNASVAFVGRAIFPGDAATRIVNQILRQASEPLAEVAIQA
jgi:hypothetical protein